MYLPLLLALASVTVTPTQAPTPTPETSTSEIQKIRDVVQQKVREKLQQITDATNPTTKKAIIGKVIQVSSSEIIIDYQNSPRTLTVDSETTYLDSKRNKSSLDKTKIGQDILALGISNSETGSFTAKRIVFIDINTIQLKQTTAFGKIVDISKSSPIFTLIPSQNKNNLFQIKTDAKTIVIDKFGKTILIPDLKSSHQIIAILVPDIKISKTYYATKIIDLDYQAQSALQTPTPTKK